MSFIGVMTQHEGIKIDFRTAMLITVHSFEPQRGFCGKDIGYEAFGLLLSQTGKGFHLG